MSCKAYKLNTCEIEGSTFQGRKIKIKSENLSSYKLTAVVTTTLGVNVAELQSNRVEDVFYFDFSSLENLKNGGYKIEYWLTVKDVARELIVLESLKVSKEPCGCSNDAFPDFVVDFSESISFEVSLSLSIVNLGDGGSVGGSSVTEFNYDEEKEVFNLEQSNEEKSFKVSFPKPKNGNDGKDGKDGKNGINGINGVDGYTPQKGIDYFDGINGKEGKDGERGVDGADGAKGEQGIQGVAGANGKDVLTIKANNEAEAIALSLANPNNIYHW